VSTGTLTQEDPIGLAGGLNLYGFAGGDPINFDDPFGLCDNDKDDPKDCRTTTPAEGREIAAAAKARVASHRGDGVTYASPPTGSGTDDCTHFCHGVTSGLGLSDIPYHTSREFESSGHFTEVTTPRAGDFVWQPRSTGLPGSGHVGVFLGENDARGRPLMAQMGTSGARIAPFGPNGWFEGGSNVRYYRPNVPFGSQ